jgi:hypothetical protein
MSPMTPLKPSPNVPHDVHILSGNEERNEERLRVFTRVT